MSTLLSAHAVGFDNAFGTLFHDIHFSLKKGDRIGLLGDNGTGKSTLLKILSGELESSQGSITLANHCLLARIEQHLPSQLQQATLLAGVIARLPEQQQISDAWRAEALLSSLGFDAEQQTQTAATLSGGQHMRLLLARALILQPDLLLLDEPSNHLDLPTLLWLEQFLISWKSSFVLVSHDSTLLDQVTNCSWILRDQTLQFFRLPCSGARQALAQQDETDAQRFQAEENEIDRIEKSAKRLAIWGRTYDNEGLSRKAQQMEKRANWLKEAQTTLTDGSLWRLKLQGEALDADRVLALPEMSIRPADNATALFTFPNLQVKSGDRIAVVGRNGSGKSSLLRQLWLEYQRETTKLFHPRARLGYYDQSLSQLQDEESLNEALAHFAPLSDDQRKMALIGAGFPYLRHQQLVGSLSGGERSRLLFVGLTLARYSILLLDEPTNHLDMVGKEELAEALNQFEGAVLLVSHDRNLIASSCNRFWLIQDQQLGEWHEFAQVIELMGAEQPLEKPVACVKPVAAESHNDEEALLLALCDLESKLDEDMMRKPKHQKPTLQTQWRDEIAQLKQLLGIS
ncbi:MULTISPECIES: ABC-F family ATP-binding cassette domain-containing protein [unclassified Pantoea]|uniref:ABC-F family ATP-binding cassette domain-containing protein n=1 Tax=unclassified Pantoea TaxID=2630326 RepID=UPI001CD66F15|nr:MULTISPECIES: ATP-binding cassette domain-containing protein [unclassified Pantoea]MCA1177739.1 ATP-binding cassette domain-containing protein [Pantoea sp. alder69]MCA1252790.1 ATP-binding cassette domain-containing protein [Pantoea sp. alder70]MCA1266497.1 ATP-binding cassette domain-containing protein [Pantoea sp. alder81]